MKKKLINLFLLVCMLNVQSIFAGTNYQVQPCMSFDDDEIRDILLIETLSDTEGVAVTLRGGNEANVTLKLVPKNPNFEYILLLLTKTKRDFRPFINSKNGTDSFAREQRDCKALRINITVNDEKEITGIVF